MNKKLLSGLILLGGISLLSSCKKEHEQTLTTANTTSESVKKVAATNLLTQQQLTTFSAITVLGYQRAPGTFSSANNATELITPYLSTAGVAFQLIVADLGFLSAAELNNYLSGVDYPVSTSTPLGTSLIIAQSNPLAGFMLNQYSGDPVNMALSLGDGTNGLFSTNLSLPNDGSFVGAYAAGPDQNISGWVVYDGKSANGNILLLVSNRFAVYISGINETPQLSNLYSVINQFDFTDLEKLVKQ